MPSCTLWETFGWQFWSGVIEHSVLNAIAEVSFLQPNHTHILMLPWVTICWTGPSSLKFDSSRGWKRNSSLTHWGKLVAWNLFIQSVSKFIGSSVTDWFFINPHNILQFLRKVGYSVPETLTKKIVAHLITTFQKPGHLMLPQVPHIMETWGKLCIKSSGDCIRAESVHVNKLGMTNRSLKCVLIPWVSPKKESVILGWGLGYLKFTVQIAMEFLLLISSFTLSPYFAYITSFFFLSCCHCDITCLSQHLSLLFSSWDTVINSTFSMEPEYLLSNLFCFIGILLTCKWLKY